MVLEDSRPGRFHELGPPRGIAEFAGVLLHGRDRTPEEIIDVATRIGRLDSMRWLAPTAETASWYPNRFSDPIAVNEPFLSRSVKQCEDVMIEASEAGRLGPARLAVMGFSQGACVAFEYALRHPGRCRAVIAFTGALMGQPAEIERHRPTSGNLAAGLEVLITGSDQDEWIDEQSTRESARVLAGLGANVTLRIYRGRHHIVSEEELAEARSFLEKHLLQHHG